MDDISPLTSGTAARRKSSPLVPIAGGMVLGGVIVAIVGVIPLIIGCLVLAILCVGMKVIW